MEGSHLGFASFFFETLPLITTGPGATLLSTLPKEASRKGPISIFALAELEIWN